MSAEISEPVQINSGVASADSEYQMEATHGATCEALVISVPKTTACAGVDAANPAARRMAIPMSFFTKFLEKFCIELFELLIARLTLTPISTLDYLLKN